MGSPIMALLGQAAPVDDQAARDARIKELLAQVAANQQADPSLMPAPAAPTPTPAPPPQAAGGGLWEMLKGAFNRFLPSTASLAPQAQPTPQALTPEQLAERNRILAGGR